MQIKCVIYHQILTRRKVEPPGSKIILCVPGKIKENNMTLAISHLLPIVHNKFKEQIKTQPYVDAISVTYLLARISTLLWSTIFF
jgi:hypothetical protein